MELDTLQFAFSVFNVLVAVALAGFFYLMRREIKTGILRQLKAAVLVGAVSWTLVFLQVNNLVPSIVLRLDLITTIAFSSLLGFGIIHIWWKGISVQKAIIKMAWGSRKE